MFCSDNNTRRITNYKWSNQLRYLDLALKHHTDIRQHGDENPRGLLTAHY